MTNKVKIILLTAFLGSAVFATASLVHGATGGLWLASVPVTIIAAIAARSIYWRVVLGMTNPGHVVATEHGPAGPIDAIEVFWRPG